MTNRQVDQPTNRPAAESTVCAIVLAAGAGARFGGRKLLAPLHGRPLAAHVAAAVAEAVQAGHLSGGLAIVTPRDTMLAWHFDTAGLRSVENPNADSGLASSLRAGLAVLEADAAYAAAGAALVVLADQPGLRSDVIGRLVQTWRRSGRSVRPRYADDPGAPGHPVLLDRALWPLARDLTGDQGLGGVLQEQPGTVETIDVRGGNPDVDTPLDLARLEESRE